jgi:GNAT superfamily N-acetyltransferase
MIYFEYIKEKLGREVVLDSSQNGFIVYTLIDGTLFIHDIYVRPEFRRQGVAKEMCDKVASLALDRGAKRIIAQCAVRSNGCNDSLMFCLHQGMQIVEANNDWIYLEDKRWSQQQSPQS